jgi:AraC-like DNA-binding protein
MLEITHFLRKGTAMVDDPFSDILKVTSAQTVVTGGFTAGGSWAIRFPAPARIKFFGVVKGGCWLCIDGEQAPVRIEAGDVFLLSTNRSFVLADDPATIPVDATSVLTAKPGAMPTVGHGGDFFLLGGHVEFASAGALLAEILPPLIHVHAASPQAAVVQWLLDQLVRERTADLPGASVASAQLAQLMFVQVLRAHLAESCPLTAGLLRALGDRKIAPALHLMHGDPGRAWQLGELARATAMSRTTFALYFKTVAGITPLAYLTRWRMQLAERALREEDIPISVLAGSLGYGSESAFSNAFKRATGNAPKRYRTAARS